MNTRNASIDGRVIAQNNERAILIWLHRFGWLRTRDLAALVWPDGSQPIQMARRTLRRLADHNEVLSHRLPDGTPIFALAARGADRIRDAYMDARSGKDLMRELKQFRHRNLCNMYAIERIRQGNVVYTERDIVANRAPINTVINKRPDLLHTSAGHPNTFAWCEVEASWKKSTDYDKLVNFIARTLPVRDNRFELDTIRNLFLEHITIVTAESSHIYRLVRALEKAVVNDYALRFEWHHLDQHVQFAILKDEIWYTLRLDYCWRNILNTEHPSYLR